MLLAAVLMPLLATCSEAPSTVAQTDWSTKLEEAPFLDLAQELHTAEIWFERELISPSLIADRRYLTKGWSFTDQGDDSQTDNIHPIWNSSQETELRFFLGEVGPCTVSFHLGTFRAVTEFEPLGVRVFLNGDPIATRELLPGGSRFELQLPQSSQRQGLNRLTLETDRIWRISDEIPGSRDLRQVAFNCREFRFQRDEESLDRRAKEARWLLPEGARIEPEGPAGSRTLSQVSASVVRHWLEVPAGAVLQSGIALTRVGDSASRTGVFRVTLTDRSGMTTVLLDEEAKVGAAIRQVSASLEAWSGQVVQLDFSIHDATGSNEPVVGTWAAPYIEAPQAPTPASLPALDAARSDLKSAPVVMILLDAFNPAFAPTYGGQPGIAPELQRFKEEGFQFDGAYCQATYTIASIPSILTSRYTWEHGAWKESTKLLDSVPTWPEAFRNAGYRTVGFTASTNGSSLFGFERGFETFLDLYTNVLPGRETIMAEQLLEPLAEVLAVEDERPLFLWLHIVEPHEPYIPPAPWAGKLSDEIDSEITATAETLWAIRTRDLVPTEVELEKLKAEYQDNISYVDSVFAKIRSQLEARGIWDAAIVTVLSDHGEAFLDHENMGFAAFGHGSTVYDDQARIPLWMRLPGDTVARGIEVQGLASNMDILPTVADLTGVASPGPDLRGVSLAPALFDTTRTPRDAAVTHTANRMNAERFLPTLSYRSGDWKYIFTSGNAEELYNLASDPGETTNLAEQEPVLAGYFLQLLRRRTGFEPTTGGLSAQSGLVELDEETIRRMQALGYVR